ncbi:MAG: 2-C-methyl-D-erythritol 2,4-cyclodiphosphate synthase [Planctomycetota bacterium]
MLLERPRIAAHRAAMRANLARALALPVDSVRLKGKSGEGLDAVGRGAAIACHAVVHCWRRRNAASACAPCWCGSGRRPRSGARVAAGKHHGHRQATRA